MADLDNSGTLTEDEGRALIAYHRKPKLEGGEGWMEVLEWSDFNKDGRMSEDELVSIMLRHGWGLEDIDNSVERLHQFAGTEAGMNYDEFEGYMESWGHKNPDDEEDEEPSKEDAVEIKI